MPYKGRDLSGMRFHRLTVIGKDKDRRGRTVLVCRCDCGNIVKEMCSPLMSGEIKSCGCFSRDTQRKRLLTHEGTGTRLYHIYRSMKSRCVPHTSSSKHYGDRGISVCDEWLGENGFIAFKAWALANGYREDLTIDRIDVNGNYCPENCRWADQKTQQRNRTNNHWITCNGETRILRDWSEIVQIHEAVILKRLKRGWTEEEALGFKNRNAV